MQILRFLRPVGGLPFLVTLVAAQSLAGPVEDLQPGHWYQVPNSRLETVFPDPEPDGYTGPRSVTDAWNGGAYDTRRDKMIVWGGGHMDYAGNEVYAFDVATLRWSRLDNPSTSTPLDVCFYPDGRPSPPHTYNQVHYSAALDAFVAVGRTSVYGSGNTVCGDVSAYNLDTRQWRKLASVGNSDAVQQGTSAVDPSTGRIYAVGNLNSQAVYDPASNSWSNLQNNTVGLGLYRTAAIDPNRRIMVAVGDPSTATSSLSSFGEFRTQSTSGDKTLEAKNSPGFVFDPTINKFVGWSGGTAVYVLDPANWTWQKVSAAATNSVTPTAPVGAGTFGRFRYVPSRNVYILVNRSSDDVYFYKLSAGAGTGSSGGGTTPPPTPTVTISASPTTLTSGGSVTLTWSSQNATSCTASGGWSGSRPTAGQATIGPLSSSATFTLACAGDGGNGSGSTSVTVQASTGGTGGTTGGSTGGSTGGTTSGSTSADSDWSTRSTASGVVRALGFDTQAQWLDHVWENTGCDSRYAPGCRMNAWDQTVKASGAGSVRFDIPSQAGASDAGSLAVNFTDNYAVQFGSNEEFWVQWRQRFDDYFIRHEYAAEGGGSTDWKQIIIGEGDRIQSDGDLFKANSCTQLEQVMRRGGIGYPLMYQTCGEYLAYQDALPYDWNFTYQNQRLRSDGRSACTLYDGREYSDTSGCLRYYPNEWMTFMVHVKLGAYGTAYSEFHEQTRTGYTNSTVEFYVARAGGPLQVAHRQGNFVIPNDTPEAQYGKVWLLPFMTNKDESEVTSSASTWYDELIISSKAIPAPGGTSTSPSPSVTLAANPTTISSGSTSTLTWTSQNASSCTASGGWSGSLELSGSRVIGPLSATTAFSINCGGASRSITVTVQAASSTNQPPLTPAIAAVGTPVALDSAQFDVTSDYADPDGDTLALSEWQISKDQEFTSLALKRTVQGSTGLALAAGVLDPGLAYWARTRHRDARGAISAWSASLPFSTAASRAGDSNGNGTVDSAEVAGFSDTNGNGTNDAEEGMCGLLDAQGGNAVGFDSDAGNLRCYDSVGSNSVPALPTGGLSMPYGLFSFRIDGLRIDPAQPATASLRVYLPSRPDGSVKWYKFDPATGQYFPLADPVAFEGNAAVLQLVDGGIGDFDGTVNGVIVDPSGPVVVAASGSGGGTGGTDSGGGGQVSSGGGSSIGLGLPALMVAAGIARRRRRLRPIRPRPAT